MNERYVERSPTKDFYGEKGHVTIFAQVTDGMLQDFEKDGIRILYLGFENLVGDPIGKNRKTGAFYHYNPELIETTAVSSGDEERLDVSRKLESEGWTVISGWGIDRVIGMRYKSNSLEINKTEKFEEKIIFERKNKKRKRRRFRKQRCEECKQISEKSGKRISKCTHKKFGV